MLHRYLALAVESRDPAIERLLHLIAADFLERAQEQILPDQEKKSEDT